MRKKINFVNCRIDISGKVFAPRIETEFWVGKAIQQIKSPQPRQAKRGGQKSKVKSKELEILDVFAGTGCIGISILKAVKNAKVSFIDIDREAIEQIKINLKLNRISRSRYKIYQSNLFEKLKNKKFDIIFANPPYVALDRIPEVDKEVLEKEPHTALFAGKDGMFYIEKFLNQVKKYLRPKGVFFLEFDPFQKKEIETILKNKGFKFVFKKDQFKKFRWLKAGTGIF